MTDKLDWPVIKALIIKELEPHRLVERIAEDRRRLTGYPWTSLPFKLWDPAEMREREFDRAVEDVIRQIKADPHTGEALRRLERLGFRYLLGTYDDPGMRLFHINVEHNEAAEARVTDPGPGRDEPTFL